MSQGNNIEIRPFSYEELPGMSHLSADAGWNQPEDELKEIIRRSEKYILGAFYGRQIVGMAAFCPFPDGVFACLNEVLVDQQWRRKGIACRILEQLIPLAAADYPVHRLCATDMGRPLYERFGFFPYAVLDYGTLSFKEIPEPDGVILPAGLEHLPGMCALDRRVYGADRSAMIRSCAMRFPADTWYIEQNGSMTGFIIRAGNKYLAQASDTDDLAALICHADKHSEKQQAVLIRHEILEKMQCSMKRIFSLTAMQSGNGLVVPEASASTMLPDIG